MQSEAQYGPTACSPVSCANGKCQADGACWPQNDREWARLHIAPEVAHVGLHDLSPMPSPPLQPDHCTSDKSRCGKRSWPWCSDCPHAGFEPGVKEAMDARRLEHAPKMRPPLKTAPAPADDLVNPKTLMGARRVDISLLPPAGIIHGAHAMMDGAEKYGPYNWREKKVPARTYIAAAMRHLMDFLDGEANAADSGVHHLGHVIGCCAIVLDALETGNLIDDRPVKGAAVEILSRLEKSILDRRARLAADPPA